MGRRFSRIIPKKIGLCRFLFSILLFAPVVSPEEKGSLFQDKKLGVSLSLPSECSANPEGITSGSVLADFKCGDATIILRGFGPITKPNFNLFEYAKYQSTNLEEFGMSVVEQPKMLLVGDKEVAMMVSESGVLHIQMRQVTYCFFDAKRKMLYHLELHSRKERFDTDAPYFKSIVEGFTIR